MGMNSNDLEMHAITSTAIGAVGYDPAARVLRVEFHSGKIYEYAGVSPYKFNRLVASETPGAYFAKCIRPKHRYRDCNWKTLPRR